MPALETADKLGLEIIWDLFHYGSPDPVDQASRTFERFTEFAPPRLRFNGRSMAGRRSYARTRSTFSRGRWTTAISRASAQTSGWFKRRLTGPRSPRHRRQAALAKATIVGANP
jgi:hypothetical protein